MIDEADVVRIRGRWEPVANAVLQRTLDDELDAVLRLGPGAIDDRRWFEALWLIWDGAGGEMADYVYSRLVAAKGLRDVVGDVGDAVRITAQRAAEIAANNAARLERWLAGRLGAVLEAETRFLYRTELGLTIGRESAQTILSATAWAQHGAARAAAATGGLTLTRIWRTVGDDRVRASHSRAAGQRRRLNEPFAVGAGLLMYPGDTAGPIEEWINCRCFLDYEAVAEVPRVYDLGF